jgi:hypothetical protein
MDINFGNLIFSSLGSIIVAYVTVQITHNVQRCIDRRHSVHINRDMVYIVFL